MNEIKYDQDFYGWTQEQTRLLRERRFAELDIDNVVEKIETLGRGERLSRKAFPATYPWSFDQVISDEFWPDEA